MNAPSSSAIARALAEFETERTNLLARVAKVDELIDMTCDTFHLPRPTRSVKPSTSTIPGDTAAAVRTALANGPLSPGALATAVGIDRAVLRPQLLALERDGVIVSTGVTANRRYALAPAAAKEAL